MVIKTTHVGSLPRTQKVVDFIFARENKISFSQEEFDKAMSEAVLETVNRQVKAGINIVSDGETSKISYATYVRTDTQVLMETAHAMHQLICSSSRRFLSDWQMMVEPRSIQGQCVLER